MRSARTRSRRRGEPAPPAIARVVVLGANGVMGQGAGALFATAVPRVTFLARSKDKARQGLAAAIERTRVPALAARARTGSYDEDLDGAVAGADLVIEALAEELDVKTRMLERVERARGPSCVVGTLTSGLSINTLCRGRTESFCRHFLGIHLFNPPSALAGVELIAAAGTDPAVVDGVDVFLRRRLGREVIRTADTPGFAGNRIGVKIMNESAQLAAEHGPVLVDTLIGPYTGRAHPPLWTIDYAGWDIHRAITDNLYANTADEAHESLELPGFMARLLDRGVRGNKSGGGFFKREGEVRLALDPATGDYLPVDAIRLPELAFVAESAALHARGCHAEAVRVLLDARGDEAAIARRVVASYLSYAFHRLGEVTETMTDIDTVMRAGFRWAPPSLLVDLMGVARAVALIEDAGLPVPALLADAAARGQALPFDGSGVDVARLFGVPRPPGSGHRTR